MSRSFIYVCLYIYIYDVYIHIDYRLMLGFTMFFQFQWENLKAGNSITRRIWDIGIQIG